MKRKIVLAAAIAGGIAAGTAGAAFIAETGTVANTFSTADASSLPQVGTLRITPHADCSAAEPAETVRQGATFYACARSVTDDGGIAAVHADLAAVADGANPNEISLTDAGGPFGEFAYRSAAVVARRPLETGSSATWSLTARNTLGAEVTVTDRTVRVRSYYGRIAGEFGAPGFADLLQYFRLSGNGPGFPNAVHSSGGATAAGGPQGGISGALIGSTDTALGFDGTDDVLTATRRSGQSYDHTMSLWLRTNPFGGSGPGTVWSDAAGIVTADAPTDAGEYGLAIDSQGRLVAGCDPAASTIRSEPHAVTQGAWHHVALTRVRAGGSLRLYIDGEQVAQTTGCTAGLHDANAWSIGRSHRSGLFFGGHLDELTFLGRALSAAEVADLYRLGTGTG